MGSPSYVIGNSRAVLDLTDAQRRTLDTAPWVFTCNFFPEHWRAAGFRSTFWLYGDNHNEHCAGLLRRQLMNIPTDPELCARLRHVWVCVEDDPELVTAAILDSGVPARTYTRGLPWLPKGQPARKLGDSVFHQGSTLTNCVNFAWLLNPGQPIYLFGNECGGPFGHFWEPAERLFVNQSDADFWGHVLRRMWLGIHDLHTTWDYPIVDCNRHGAPLPDGITLPVGTI